MVTINPDLEEYAKRESIDSKALETELQNEYLDIIRNLEHYNDRDTIIEEINNAKCFLELTGISPSDETYQKIFENHINYSINHNNIWANIYEYAKELGLEDVSETAIIYGCNECIKNEQLDKLEYFRHNNKTIPEESILFGFEHYAKIGKYDLITELKKHTKLKPGDETYSAIHKRIQFKEQTKV